MIKNIFLSLKTNIKSIIIFEMIYKVITFFIIAPLNVMIINNAIATIDLSYVGNMAFGDVLSSFSAATGLFLMIIISFLWIYIEMYVVTSLIHQTKNNIEMSFKIAFQNCFTSLRKLLTIRAIPLMLLLCFIGPASGVGLYNSLIKDINLPTFMVDVILSKSWGFVIYFGGYILLYFLFAKWSLIIPKMVINDCSLKENFKAVKEDFKFHYIYIIGCFTIWFLIMLSFRLISVDFYLNTGDFFYDILPSWSLNAFTTIYLLLFILGYTICLAIVTPLFPAILLEINNRLSDDVRIYPDVKITRDGLSPFRKILLVCITGLFSFMIFQNCYEIIHFQKLTQDISVTAHRGGGYLATDNTLYAIEVGINEGATHVEIDAQLTKDNVVVLYHDATMDKLGLSGKYISQYTYAELQQMDPGAWYGEQHLGLKIPTLEEAILFCEGKVTPNIEIKIVNNNWFELSNAVNEVITRLDKEDEVVVTSINYNAIKHLRAINKNVKIGHIVTMALGEITYDDFDFVAIEFNLLTSALVEQFKQANKEVHVWTVNSVAHIEMCIKYRVDNIITDEMALATSLIENAKLDVEHNRELLDSTVKRVLKFYRL